MRCLGTTRVREDIQAPIPTRDEPRKGFYQTRMLRWSLEGPTGVWRGGEEQVETIGGGSRVDKDQAEADPENHKTFTLAGGGRSYKSVWRGG